jgi:hypothetical protein
LSQVENPPSHGLRDHRIELYDEVLTVEEIQAKYQLFKLRYCLDRIFEDNTEKEMLKEMRTMNSVMGVTRDMMIEAQRVQNY